MTADHETDQPEQSVDFVMTDEGWFLGVLRDLLGGAVTGGIFIAVI